MFIKNMQNSNNMFHLLHCDSIKSALEVFYIPCTWIQKTAAQVQYPL